MLDLTKIDFENFRRLCPDPLLQRGYDIDHPLRFYQPLTQSPL